MQPFNRRVEFVFSIFQWLPSILGENDIVLRGDDLDVLNSRGIDGKILYTPGQDTIRFMSKTSPWCMKAGKGS